MLEYLLEYDKNSLPIVLQFSSQDKSCGPCIKEIDEFAGFADTYDKLGYDTPGLIKKMNEQFVEGKQGEIGKKVKSSSIEKIDLGNTIKVISFVEFEDGTTAKPKVLLEEKKNDIYDNIEYDELIDIYIKRLKRKVKIVSSNYDEVYISLTGGADSRLVTSLFKEYNNVYHYCYGDGTRQDRLVSEYIIENLNLKSKKDIPIVGNRTN